VARPLARPDVGYDLLRFWILERSYVAIAGYCNGQVAGGREERDEGRDPGTNLRLTGRDALGVGAAPGVMVWKPGH